MFNRTISFVSISVAIALLSGCGGGGGSNGPVISTDLFPMAQAYAVQAVAGRNSNFIATQGGMTFCSGSGNITDAPATTSTPFNITPTSSSVPAVSAAETLTVNWTNCIPPSTTVPVTLYYTPTTFVPLGMTGTNSPGGNYGAYLTAATIPATVTVGASGVIGTENLYTDKTETTSSGRIDGSYVVTADTASTAIITLIGNQYDATSTLTLTKQDAWRITATGGLTPITTNIQLTNGNDIVFTYY